MENLKAEQVKSNLAICALGDCQACRYNKFIAGCRDELCGDALALINKQETEYNELYELCESYRLENESVRRRMQHLCQSKFIASFDEVDRKTKEYKRNIAEADILIEVKEQYEIENIALSAEIEWLTNENKRLNKLLDDKCDRCIERERADTVRKMQERLKDALNDMARYDFHGNNNEYFIIGKSFIDRIAKEMEGENNG